MSNPLVESYYVCQGPSGRQCSLAVAERRFDEPGLCTECDIARTRVDKYRWPYIGFTALVGILGLAVIVYQNREALFPTIHEGITFAAEVVRGTEAIGFAEIPLNVRPKSRQIRLKYRLESESALAGSDFLAGGGELVVPANAASAVIQVTILRDMEPYELSETFTVVLENVAGNPVKRIFIEPPLLVREHIDQATEQIRSLLILAEDLGKMVRKRGIAFDLLQSMVPSSRKDDIAKAIVATDGNIARAGAKFTLEFKRLADLDNVQVELALASWAETLADRNDLRQQRFLDELKGQLDNFQKTSVIELDGWTDSFAAIITNDSPGAEENDKARRVDIKS